MVNCFPKALHMKLMLNLVSYLSMTIYNDCVNKLYLHFQSKPLMNPVFLNPLIQYIYILAHLNMSYAANSQVVHK